MNGRKARDQSDSDTKIISRKKGTACAGDDVLRGECQLSEKALIAQFGLRII